jgi:hypothetical protein
MSSLLKLSNYVYSVEVKNGALFYAQDKSTHVLPFVMHRTLSNAVGGKSKYQVAV